MKNYTLYGLNKPGEEARYIGITCQALQRRLARHIREQSDDHRGAWLVKAKSENIRVEIVPYCVGLSKEGACELEVAVIAELRKAGLDLVNTHEGGGLPPVCWGNKHGLGKGQGNKNALGYKHTPGWRAAASQRMLGIQNALGCKRTPEWCAAKSQSMLENKYALGQKKGKK